MALEVNLMKFKYVLRQDLEIKGSDTNSKQKKGSFPKNSGYRINIKPTVSYRCMETIQHQRVLSLTKIGHIARYASTSQTLTENVDWNLPEIWPYYKVVLMGWHASIWMIW